MCAPLFSLVSRAAAPQCRTCQPILSTAWNGKGNGKKEEREKTRNAAPFASLNPEKVHMDWKPTSDMSSNGPANSDKWRRVAICSSASEAQPSRNINNKQSHRQTGALVAVATTLLKLAIKKGVDLVHIVDWRLFVVVASSSVRLNLRCLALLWLSRQFQLNRRYSRLGLHLTATNTKLCPQTLFSFLQPWMLARHLRLHTHTRKPRTLSVLSNMARSIVSIKLLQQSFLH